MTSADKEIPVCKYCGSSNVTCDSISEWDVEKQQWVQSALLDTTDCEDCGGQTKVEFKQLSK